MKNFPHEVALEGPKVTWVKKVNDVIRVAKYLKHPEDLIRLLGYPERVEYQQHEETFDLSEYLGSALYYSELHTESVFIYSDPYRASHRHCFGVRDGKIVTSWRNTLCEHTASYA